ncbi:MAG: bifunctional DNA-binding transcriptional regulator/O6-methylguanine-DNA methyltransferase Ada [Thermoanaerobaculia bacterium]
MAEAAILATLPPAPAPRPTFAPPVLTSPAIQENLPSPSVARPSRSEAAPLPGADRESDESCWRAVTERDGNSDGRFVFAVTSTGVYCRPSCPARRPRRENVRFFEDGAAARAAGFRACKRCRPDELPAIERAIARARELMDEAEGEAIPLAQLGAATGVSPFHLQREFRRRLGMTPKQYALARRAERLQTGMKRSRTVLDAGFEAGYGSSSRLYAEASRRLGMTPGRFKDGGAGAEIRFATGSSPVGAVLVAATERGLCAVRLGASPVELERSLRRDFPRANIVEDRRRLRPFLAAVSARVTRASELDLPTDLAGTAFQALVWEELRRIPSGETRSYGEIARAIGRPRAVRAVARACATNPVALVVPCHRVVGSDGALTGYRWGVRRKKALLALEAER